MKKTLFLGALLGSCLIGNETWARGGGGGGGGGGARGGSARRGGYGGGGRDPDTATAAMVTDMDTEIAATGWVMVMVSAMA